MFSYMAQRLLKPDPENASMHELKEAARVGTTETALRCTAMQMLLPGTHRHRACLAQMDQHLQ